METIMVPTMLPMNPNVNGSLWKKRKSSKKIKIKVKNSSFVSLWKSSTWVFYLQSFYESRNQYSVDKSELILVWGCLSELASVLGLGFIRRLTMNAYKGHVMDLNWFIFIAALNLLFFVLCICTFSPIDLNYYWYFSSFNFLFSILIIFSVGNVMC